MALNLEETKKICWSHTCFVNNQDLQDKFKILERVLKQGGPPEKMYDAIESFKKRLLEVDGERSDALKKAALESLEKAIKEYKICEQGTSETALTVHAPPKNQREPKENEERFIQQTANANTKTEDDSENHWLERVRNTLGEVMNSQGSGKNSDKAKLQYEIEELISRLSKEYCNIKIENEENLKKVKALQSEVHHYKRQSTLYGQQADEKELLFQRSMTETDIRGGYGTIKGDSKKVLERYKKEIEDLRGKVTQLNEEKNYWLKRVSEIAGAKLTDGNAQITDLSDPNRPIKLAERFGELYDSNWTNVLEEYTDHAKSTDDVLKREKEAIDGMKAILKECFNHCKEEAEKITTETSKALKLTKNEVTNEVEQEIKGLRKLASQRILDVMTKSMSDKVMKNSKIRKMKTVEEFVQSCVDVCWFMVIQEPPLQLDFCEAGKNCPFDSNRFQFYTRSGKIMDYVVWPALLLHDKGPLLRKGVAEPVHEKKKK